MSTVKVSGNNDGSGRPPVELATTTNCPEGANLRELSEPVPGVVVIFSDGCAAHRVIRVEGGSIELGRLELSGGEYISRKHVRLAFDGVEWQVTDLRSRNGTFVKASLISGETRAPSGSLVRLGGVVLLLMADVVPFERHGLGVRDNVVGGPLLRAALESIARTCRVGMVSSLLITGESGTGKEIAARTFHALGPKPNAPFAAVNCAAIPKELAERLLFGAQRGAFSGATDAQGHVQAANGGTLFLDEIAELAPDVQSKLLRMLETREVLRLGATRYEPVDVRVCAATLRNLREEVGAGRFRQDLYFRIAQGEVSLPPLRRRIEEIPWHVQQILDECGKESPLAATAAFVEACALRRWPGNVRELRAEVRRAAAAAAGAGSNTLSADDLGTTAGKAMISAPPPPSSARFPDDEFAAALTAEQGNVVNAARRLGVHRNKVRRWLERHEVEARRFKSTGRTRPS